MLQVNRNKLYSLISGQRLVLKSLLITPQSLCPYNLLQNLHVCEWLVVPC